MKESMKLRKQLNTLCGDKIEELSFDFESLTPMDYKNILAIESRLKGQNMNTELSVSRKTSSEFRMASAWIAAVKGTKGICMDDIDRLYFLDLLELDTIGSVFIYEVE